MRSIAGALGRLLMPGSVSLLILGLVVGAALLYVPRLRTWGRRLLTVLALSYWALSVPIGADAILAVLSHGYAPIRSAADARGATTIVVLDGSTQHDRVGGDVIDAIGSASALRAIETLRVYRLLDRATIIVSGGIDRPHISTRLEGAKIKDELIRAGVPPGQILLDTTSRDTRESALHVAPLLQARRVLRIVLVTSPAHIRRATGAFRRVGIDVVPSPAAARSDDDVAWRWTAWRPRLEALQQSDAGFHDAISYLYYWSRGWLR